jgi:aryl-alcohol dehydrogenase
VLGLEGAGIVESVGADVLKVAPGDSVVLTFLTCGRCKPCRLGRMAHCEKTFPLSFGGARLDGSTATLDAHGEKVHGHFFGQSSFATYALANERNVVKVSRDLPLELLGPLGCGIQTGAGAVMNALNVRPGTSFASFGAGAVGCSAIMAARAVGATTIVAIDIVPSRLEMAKELGATHAINSKQTDPVEAIRDISGGGVDYSRMREGGSVVNMSSALGLVGGAGICAYVASKHAIIGLTKTAALEQGARGVRVNACCPGPIAGRMTFKLAEQVFAGSEKTFAETVPLGRHGTPEDVAGLVSYLLSDDSSYATGTAHSVDGGFTTA